MTDSADGQWPLRCACGRSWTEHAWKRLHLVGETEQQEGALELRVCTCGSTISQLIPRTPRV